MNKTLKDFGVRGGSVRGVCVFLYVMHTKKAQIPRSDTARMRHQQLQQDLAKRRKINLRLQVLICV